VTRCKPVSEKSVGQEKLGVKVVMEGLDLNVAMISRSARHRGARTGAALDYARAKAVRPGLSRISEWCSRLLAEIYVLG